MKILIHDFCGHPFTLALAEQLAANGHDVDFIWFASETGPKGDFVAAAAKARAPRLHGLAIEGQYRKDAFLARRRHDLAYARQLFDCIRDIRPDVLLSGNCPTEVQDQVVRACQKTGTAFVYWMQDFYSIAATKLLGKKLGVLGRAIGGYWRYLDCKHLRASDRIVLIAEDFRTLTERWTGRADNVEVIENWSVLAKIPVRPHENAWSCELGIEASVNFVYSGTLGLKHDPELLVELARGVATRAQVTVVSSGASVPYLEQRKRELGLDNLRLLPLQPFATLPDMLGAADVLVAMIEPDAGTFSVPSKVLSYLCAGRPILLAAPSDNLAARIVRQAEAGKVVEPGDKASFMTAALGLLDNPARAEMGAGGRRYAEQHFDIATVARRFEGVFDKALAARGRL